MKTTSMSINQRVEENLTHTGGECTHPLKITVHVYIYTFENTLLGKIEIFIVDLKCIMNMAIYDIAGEVAESASIFKIDVNAEGTCRHQ